MLFYFGLVLLCLVVWGYIHQISLRSKQSNSIEDIIIQKRISKATVLFAIIFILLIGLRNSTVGNDAWNYRLTYERMANSNGYQSLKGIGFLQEPGYRFLLIFLNSLGLSWNAFFLISACIYVIPLFILIYQESDNVMFSITLFVLNGYFVFPMSTMRQSIAMGFCLIGYLLLKKKKYALYFLFTAIGITFHVSAIISLAYFVIYHIKFTKANAKIWSAIAFLFIAIGFTSLRDIFTNILSFIGREYTEVETGGLFREAYFIITIVLSLIILSQNTELAKKDEMALKAVLVTAMILPIIRFHPALSRTYMYFAIFELVLIPNMLKRLKGSYLNVLGTVMYLFTGCYLMYIQIASRRLIPYIFFWN